MAEVKDLDQLPQTAEDAAPEQSAQPTAAKSLKERWGDMPRKQRRKIIRRIVILLVLVAAIAAAVKIFGGKGGEETQVVTDIVQYGSITSMVESSGLTKAKSSETITLTTSGTVLDVFVTEGQKVTAGTALFTIDSPAAETAVQKARSDVEGFEKQLSQAQKDIAGLNLSAPFAGKIMLKEYAELRVGEEVAKGAQVAELNDDTKLRLEQYYSYAYAGDLYVGQPVQVSIPAMMTTVPGTVEAVHMVSRITPEGSKLFSAEIVLNNEGSLTADMAASATVTVGGETVYPYEQG